MRDSCEWSRDKFALSQKRQQSFFVIAARIALKEIYLRSCFIIELNKFQLHHRREWVNVLKSPQSNNYTSFGWKANKAKQKSRRASNFISKSFIWHQSRLRHHEALELLRKWFREQKRGACSFLLRSERLRVRARNDIIANCVNLCVKRYFSSSACKC